MASAKAARLALNPMVLELAMLSPTTDSSWLFDCRPVAPV
jgi:hypothetical protein